MRRAVALHFAHGALAGSNQVFDAALARAGTIRVNSSLQLFAAARMLAQPAFAWRAAGDIDQRRRARRVAADAAIDNGIALAEFSPNARSPGPKFRRRLQAKPIPWT